MSWDFSSDRPIYLQIIDELIVKIIAKEYLPGQKLPSVRELASEIKVNPNTLQKAFGELEALNIINTKRTSGRFVTEDEEVLKQLKNNLAYKYTDDFLNNLMQIGFNSNDAQNFIKKRRKDE